MGTPPWRAGCGRGAFSGAQRLRRWRQRQASGPGGVALCCNGSHKHAGALSLLLVASPAAKDEG